MNGTVDNVIKKLALKTLDKIHDQDIDKILDIMKKQGASSKESAQ